MLIPLKHMYPWRIRKKNVKWPKLSPMGHRIYFTQLHAMLTGPGLCRIVYVLMVQLVKPFNIIEERLGSIFTFVNGRREKPIVTILFEREHILYFLEVNKPPPMTICWWSFRLSRGGPLSLLIIIIIRRRRIYDDDDDEEMWVL